MGTADAQKDAAVHLFLSLHPAVFFEDLTDASRKNIGSALERSISFFSFVPLHGLFLADGFWRFLRPHAVLAVLAILAVSFCRESFECFRGFRERKMS